jgi:prevent-host-death family protein
MRVTNIHEAKTHLSKLVERVAGGEEIIIAKAGRPVARLIPYKATTKPIRKPGSMKGKIKILPGFDALDKEIEKLFYEGPIEPPARHTRSAVVARRK